MIAIIPYAGIICPKCGPKDISVKEYIDQLEDPDSMWTCPICGSESEFNDTRLEELQGISNEIPEGEDK